MNHEWTIEEYDRRKDPAKQVRYLFVWVEMIKHYLIRKTPENSFINWGFFFFF
jgi:hypothetical protein